MPTTNFPRAHTYDALGRPIRVRTKMDGTDYYVDTGFDANSRPETLTYPGGFVIRNVYNAYGYHSEVRRVSDSALLWKLDSLDPDDSVAGETLGNGLSTATYRDQARGHIVSIMTGLGGGSSVQNLAYSWDLDGNLLTRSDHNQGGLTESFSYDRLHRLTRNQNSAGGANDYRYDALGNLTFKSGVGTYVYDSNKPHQLSRVDGAKGALFLYDANGNLTSSSGRLVSYYSYDLPKDIQQIVPLDSGAHLAYIGTLLEGLLAAGQVTYNRSQFWYGPERARYKQVLSRVGGPPQNETTYYVGNLYEKVQQGSAVTHRNYVRAYGRVVAIHHRYGSGGEQTLYPHRDHLGSVDVVTRNDRSVVERLSYDAFGKRRNSNWMNDTQGNQLYDVVHATNRGYTGHEHLDAVGLIHMNGRVYDPVYGRFMSADPYIQFPDNTQSYNRYSYVLNNPLSYTDPSGFGIWGNFKKWLAKHDTFRQVLSAAALFIPIPGVNQYVAAAIRGFTSGLIGSNGDLRSAVVGAFSAGLNQHAFGGPASNLSATEVLKTVALNTIAAQNAKVGQALMFMQGSIGLNPGEIFQNAIGHVVQYQASRQLSQWAGRHGLTLGELNLLLTVNSFAGKELAGTTFNPESGSVEGFFSRDDSGSFGAVGKYAGVLWDINDTLLNAQGLLDAVSISVVQSGYSGPMTGHSLGAWRLNNLHRQGLAKDVTLLSLPGPAYPSARTRGACGNLDLICGGAPLTLMRPGTTQVESPNMVPWQWINKNHKIDTVPGYDEQWPEP